jgi:hypothetical protein
MFIFRDRSDGDELKKRLTDSVNVLQLIYAVRSEQSYYGRGPLPGVPIVG